MSEVIIMPPEIWKFLSKLADRYGVTTEEFIKLLAGGGISDEMLEQFQDEEVWV